LLKEEVQPFLSVSPKYTHILASMFLECSYSYTFLWGFWIIFNFSFIKLNLSSTRGLVNISTNWFSVSTKINSISFLFTWSLIKWCFISICFDLECWMGFFHKFIALVLSQNIGIFVYLIEKSSSWFFIHNTWEQQFVADTYSASVVDSAIVFCFLHDQQISAFPRNWHAPLVLFLSILSPA